MRSRPATGTASSVNSCSRCLSPRSGAMTASTNSLRRVPPWSKPIANAASLRSQDPQLLRDASGLPAPKSGRGTEAATPGLPVALGAFLEVFPRGNSLSPTAGCHWLCRNHPTRSGTITFRCNQCHSVCFGGQQKTPLTLCRTCGRCDFPVEERGKLRKNPGSALERSRLPLLIQRERIARLAGQAPKCKAQQLQHSS